MFRRSLLICAAVLAVSACSTTNDGSEMGEISVEERQDITPGPLDGTQITDRGYIEQGPVPGQHLHGGPLRDGVADGRAPRGGAEGGAPAQGGDAQGPDRTAQQG